MFSIRFFKNKIRQSDLHHLTWGIYNIGVDKLVIIKKCYNTIEKKLEKNFFMMYDQLATNVV